MKTFHLTSSFSAVIPRLADTAKENFWDNWSTAGCPTSAESGVPLPLYPLDDASIGCS